VFVHYYIVI